MGVYPTHQAQQIADDMNLDLVEIAPNATPPVCRIMDYGKFKYDQAIKAKQARKNQNKIEGRNMHMLIAPLPATAKKKKDSKNDEGKDN